MKHYSLAIFILALIGFSNSDAAPAKVSSKPPSVFSEPPSSISVEFVLYERFRAGVWERYYLHQTTDSHWSLCTAIIVLMFTFPILILLPWMQVKSATREVIKLLLTIVIVAFTLNILSCVFSYSDNYTKQALKHRDWMHLRQDWYILLFSLGREPAPFLQGQSHVLQGQRELADDMSPVLVDMELFKQSYDEERFAASDMFSGMINSVFGPDPNSPQAVNKLFQQ